jgi:hypothetical protein
MVAMPGALLAHVPPPGSVNVIEAATHNADGPPIGEGNGLTVIAFVI